MPHLPLRPAFPSSRVFRGLGHGDHEPRGADLRGGCTSSQSHGGRGAAEEGQRVPTGATAHLLGGGAGVFVWVLGSYGGSKQ